MKDILVMREKDKAAFEMYPNTEAISGNQIVINVFSYDEVLALSQKGMEYKDIVKQLEPNCTQYCYDIGDNKYYSFMSYYKGIIQSRDYILISEGEYLKGED